MRLNKELLIEARENRGWTQEQAAQAAGVSLPTYNRAENGKEVQPPNAKRIADALELVLAKVRVRSTDALIIKEQIDLSKSSINEDEAQEDVLTSSNEKAS